MSLLAHIVAEPERLVRRSAAAVACVVAKHTLPHGQWNELLSFMMTCAQVERNPCEPSRPPMHAAHSTTVSVAPMMPQLLSDIQINRQDDTVHS